MPRTVCAPIGGLCYYLNKRNQPSPTSSNFKTMTRPSSMQLMLEASMRPVNGLKRLHKEERLHLKKENVSYYKKIGEYSLDEGAKRPKLK